MAIRKTSRARWSLISRCHSLHFDEAVAVFSSRLHRFAARDWLTDFQLDIHTGIYYGKPLNGNEEIPRPEKLSKPSVVDLCAERIVETIHSGEWEELIPPIRVLCGTLGVNPATLNAALKKLVEKGMLEHRGDRKRYGIASKTKKSKAAGGIPPPRSAPFSSQISLHHKYPILPVISCLNWKDCSTPRDGRWSMTISISSIQGSTGRPGMCASLPGSRTVLWLTWVKPFWRNGQPPINCRFFSSEEIRAGRSKRRWWRSQARRCSAGR